MALKLKVGIPSVQSIAETPKHTVDDLLVKQEEIQETVVIWCDAGVRFFIVKGDWSHLHQKFMDSGSITPKESEEIFNLVWQETDNGKGKKLKVTMMKTFPLLAVIHGAKVIVTGNLL